MRGHPLIIPRRPRALHWFATLFSVAAVGILLNDMPADIADFQPYAHIGVVVFCFALFCAQFCRDVVITAEPCQLEQGWTFAYLFRIYSRVIPIPAGAIIEVSSRPQDWEGYLFPDRQRRSYHHDLQLNCGEGHIITLRTFSGQGELPNTAVQAFAEKIGRATNHRVRVDASIQFREPVYSRLQVVLSILAASCFLLFGLYITRHGVTHASDEVASSDWPMAEGVVTSSKMGTADDGSFHTAVMHYDYTVDGVKIDKGPVTIPKELVMGVYSYRNALDQYRPGSTLRVHYHPEDHKRVVLVPGLSFAGAFIVAFGMGFVAFGALALYASLNLKRANPEEATPQPVEPHK